MAKKITLGRTRFSDLPLILKLTEEELEARKARLFPIGKATDETDTTSIFLASLSAVKEYREELLSNLGINKIKNRNVQLHAFTEIPDGSEENRPDGLLVITSGKNNPIIEWAGFIEAKIGKNSIDEAQVQRYIDFAVDIGIKDIITISNQLVTTPFDSPVSTKKRSFNLYHWSWQFLKVTASYLIRTDQVDDEDHVYILSELRRYFDAHKNINSFVHMGQDWSKAIAEIHDYTADQKVSNSTLSVICDAYIQEEKDVALQLTDRSNFHIQLLAKGVRETDIIEQIQSSKTIESTYMVEGDKKNTFTIKIDLTRHVIHCQSQVVIDKGKAQAQTTAMLRMLESDSGYTDSIYIDAIYPRNKSVQGEFSIDALLNQKNASEQYGILDKELGDEVKHFVIRTRDELGKDFKASKNFITQLEDIAYRFLTQVVANIRK